MQVQQAPAGWAIVVDRAKCTGHGRCYALAGEYFDSDDEGFPVILAEHVATDSPGLGRVRDSVDNCPERAITLHPKD